MQLNPDDLTLERQFEMLDETKDVSELPCDSLLNAVNNIVKMRYEDVSIAEIKNIVSDKNVPPSILELFTTCKKKDLVLHYSLFKNMIGEIRKVQTGEQTQTECSKQFYKQITTQFTKKI